MFMTFIAKNETLSIPEDLDTAHVDKIPLYDVYHTLENDMNAMIEQNRLQVSNR